MSVDPGRAMSPNEQYETVPLSQGRTALVDIVDYEAVAAAGPWHVTGRPTLPYARRSRRERGRVVTLTMHAFLTGFPVTDHINGDGLDNRRANLRPADAVLNNFNRKRRTTNRSGFKGVSWLPQQQEWVARITCLGRTVNLGRYGTPEKAALAYDDAAIELHGEFARLNFPIPGASA